MTATDALGFPVTGCTKCAGAGSIAAYHNVHHGTCYRCGGTGAVYPTRAIGREAARWAALLREAADLRANTSWRIDPATGQAAPQPHTLTPGTVIRPARRTGPPAPWRTIAAARATARVIGGGTTSWWLETAVTFTDGSRARVGSETWETQPPAELLAEVERAAAASRAAYQRSPHG